MATYTEKLGLKLPAQTDFYNIDDFNENFRKIDGLAVLKGTTAPTTATVGIIGQFYLDTEAKMLYQCVSAEDGVYGWFNITLDSSIGLSPDVATAFGLTGNPQVKDALASIGNTFSTLNIYKWDKLAYSVNPSTFSHYQAANISVPAADTNVATVSIAYSAELNFSIDGVPTLRNPITITDTLANIVAKYDATLKGKYVSNLSDNWIYHVHPTMGSLSHYRPTGGSGYYLSAYRDIVYPNLWGYNYIQKTVYAPVSSTDPLKYPQSGAAGDYLYQYAGALHDFSTIGTGSYTGTGTYGVNNKNSLTFEFVPKIIFIQQVAPNGVGSSNGAKRSFMAVNGVSGEQYSGGANNQGVMLSWSSNTVTWYNPSGGASYQLNDSGASYVYVALG